MKLLGLGAILLLSGSAFGTREKEEENNNNIRRFNTPFIPCGADPSGKGSCIVLDKNIYQSLLKIPVDTLIEFNQFQTERNTKAILRLKRFSASTDGDDLDKVVLLRGSAFEEDSYSSISSDDYFSSFEMKPSRTALIALSPYGSNGYVEIMNSTFILTTPWEEKEDEEKEDEDEEKEEMKGEEYKQGRAIHNEYTLALRKQAQRFLPQIQNTLKDFNMNYISVIYNSVILNRPVPFLKNDGIIPPPTTLEAGDEYQAIQKRSTPYDSSTNNLIKTFRVATDVDYDMYKKKGSNRDATSSYYYTLVGHCGSIYRRDFGSDFVSSYLKIYTQPDPYPGTASKCLTYMRQNWDPKTPSRSFAMLISAKGLGGGIAYVRALCGSYGYAVNGNMVGSYPIPVQSFVNGNWDISLVLHEVGHVWGASHTHELGIDKCNVTPCPPTKGTIMSYCDLCQGGSKNIELVFHSRNIQQVKPYISTLNC